MAGTVGAALLAGCPLLGLRRATRGWVLALDGAALVERAAPLVVAEAVALAGLLAVAAAGAAELAGALAGAAAAAGAGEAGADAAGETEAGGAEAGGGGDDGVPKPGAVHAQAMLTPITAAPSTDKTATAITRVLPTICTTPFPNSSLCFSRRCTVAQPDTPWGVFHRDRKPEAPAHPAV